MSWGKMTCSTNCRKPLKIWNPICLNWSPALKMRMCLTFVCWSIKTCRWHLKGSKRLKTEARLNHFCQVKAIRKCIFLAQVIIIKELKNHRKRSITTLKKTQICLLSLIARYKRVQLAVFLHTTAAQSRRLVWEQRMTKHSKTMKSCGNLSRSWNNQ